MKSISIAVCSAQVVMRSFVGIGCITAGTSVSESGEDRKPTLRHCNVFRHHFY